MIAITCVISSSGERKYSYSINRPPAWGNGALKFLSVTGAKRSAAKSYMIGLDYVRLQEWTAGCRTCPSGYNQTIDA